MTWDVAWDIGTVVWAGGTYLAARYLRRGWLAFVLVLPIALLSGAVTFVLDYINEPDNAYAVLARYSTSAINVAFGLFAGLAIVAIVRFLKHRKSIPQDTPRDASLK